MWQSLLNFISFPPGDRMPRYFSATVLRCILLTAVLPGIQMLATRTAAASCGDWLADHAPADASAGRSAEPGLRDSVAGQLPDGLGVNVFSDLPAEPWSCNGPDCRRSPDVPDAPLSPVKLQSGMTHWLLGTASPRLSAGCLGAAGCADRGASYVSAERDRIERPPCRG